MAHDECERLVNRMWSTANDGDFQVPEPKKAEPDPALIRRVIASDSQFSEYDLREASPIWFEADNGSVGWLRRQPTILRWRISFCDRVEIHGNV